MWHLTTHRSVEKLITCGTVATMDPSGEHILHIAANCPHSRMIELLTARWPEYTNFANDDGITPLHVAGMYGRLSAVQTLVDNGADPNAVDDEGMTPLDYANQEGHVGCVEYFNSLEVKPEDEMMEEDSMAIAYTSLETTLLDSYNDTTLCYTINDITLHDTTSAQEELQFTNSMLRAELIKMGEKPGPVNELTRDAYLRYLHKVKSGLVPTQSQGSNSKYYHLHTNFQMTIYEKFEKQSIFENKNL